MKSTMVQLLVQIEHKFSLQNFVDIIASNRQSDIEAMFQDFDNRSFLKFNRNHSRPTRCKIYATLKNETLKTVKCVLLTTNIPSPTSKVRTRPSI